MPDTDVSFLFDCDRVYFYPKTLHERLFKSFSFGLLRDTILLLKLKEKKYIGAGITGPLQEKWMNLDTDIVPFTKINSKV